ncbi:MAG: hypothetical protein QM817_30915 [Archangium sp.]
MSQSHARREGVLSLALAVVVSQLHPIPVQVEPPEAVAVRSFIDDHLVTFEAFNAPRRIRQGSRTFNVDDDDFPSAFSLLPELHTLAGSVQDNYRSGMRWTAIGTVVELTGALTVGILPVINLAVGISTTVMIAAMIAASAVTVVGLVITFIGLPALIKSQVQMFELVSRYNHELTRRPITVLPTAPQPASVAPVLQLEI